MTMLVSDAGLAPDDWKYGYIPLAALAAVQVEGVRLAVDIAVPVLAASEWLRLRDALPRIALIRIRLRHFGDCPGYDLARDLRSAGFRGRLRAQGAVAPRFYTLMRRAGFTEVELSADQALHQPGEHWHNERAWFPRRLREAAPTVDPHTPL